MSQGLRIYVCGSVSERPRIAKHIARLRDIGYEIVRDWPGLPRDVLPLDPIEREAYRLAYAQGIARDIASADVLWAVGSEGMKTVFAEVGYALGVGVKEVLYSHGRMPAGVMGLARRFKRPMEVLHYLHERAHGTPLPEEMIARWAEREGAQAAAPAAGTK